MSYICYVVKYKEDILYIGEGKEGRELHCKSGVSHVYELNKIYFSSKFENSEIKVDIVLNAKTKEEVISKETELINLHTPWFNKKFNYTYQYKTALDKAFNFIASEYLKTNKRDRLLNTFLKITKHIVNEGVGELYFGIKYRGHSGIISLIKAIKSPDNNYIKNIFYTDRGYLFIKKEFIQFAINLYLDKINERNL